MIATLEVGLGLPWPETVDRSVPVRLGDLPVDRCGMVVGGAVGLDAWNGMGGEPADGLVDVIEVGGCRVLGIDWGEGDHSIRHRGERDAGQVYPVTLEADEAGGTVMRWCVPPHDFDGEFDGEDE